MRFSIAILVDQRVVTNLSTKDPLKKLSATRSSVSPKKEPPRRRGEGHPKNGDVNKSWVLTTKNVDFIGILPPNIGF
jgi:hypothetical protein